jgi:hypothetical protein
VVWQAVLSLVLMNPNKGKGGRKVRSTPHSRTAQLLRDDVQGIKECCYQ